MKKIILAGIALFLVSSGGVFAGDIAAGKVKSATCAGCHGADGNSMIPAFPKLAGQNEAYFIKQLKDYKANTTRKDDIMFGMVLALSDEDMADIAAFYQSQSLSQAAPFDEAKAAIGREIYKGGNMQTAVPACMACHGPTGAGVAGIGYPMLAGQFVEYTLSQLKAFKDGSRSNDEKRLMRDIVEKMSDEDLEAVAHYIASLKP